jgi:hypothetical protein
MIERRKEKQRKMKDRRNLKRNGREERTTKNERI